jgi:hypothetical protein
MKLRELDRLERETIAEKFNVTDHPVWPIYEIDDGYLFFIFFENSQKNRVRNIWKVDFDGKVQWKIAPAGCDKNEYTCSYNSAYKQNNRIVVRNILAGDYYLNTENGSIEKIEYTDQLNKEVKLDELSREAGRSLALQFHLPDRPLYKVYEIEDGYLFLLSLGGHDPNPGRNLWKYDFKGRQQWKVEQTDYILGTNNVYDTFLNAYIKDGKIIVRSFNDSIYVLNPADGTLQYYGCTR